MKSSLRLYTLLPLLFVAGTVIAQQPKIFWGDEVPAGWTGKWPADLLTVPERTNYTRTMSTEQMHEWIAALKLKSENVHVVRMFTSPLLAIG